MLALGDVSHPGRLDNPSNNCSYPVNPAHPVLLLLLLLSKLDWARTIKSSLTKSLVGRTGGPILQPRDHLLQRR